MPLVPDASARGSLIPLGTPALPDRPTNCSKATFWRRCRRAGVSCIIILLLLLVSGYWFVLSPTRVAHMARAELERITGGEVSIGSARLDLSGVIHLSDVRVRAPELAGEGAEVFRTEDIIMTCDPAHLWRGDVQPLAITMRRPVFTLAEIIDPRTPETGEAPRPRFNVQHLDPDERGPADMTQWPRLPRVELDRARYRFGEIHNDRFEVSAELLMHGQVTVDSDQPGLFHLRLEELAGVAPRDAGLRVIGAIDIHQAVAQARVEGLGINDRYRDLLPTAARSVLDELDPAGQLPELNFAYDQADGWRAQVRVAELAMTLPRLPGAGRRYRMTDVAGLIRFDAAGIRIVEPLVGQIEGLGYTVAGTLRGYQLDAPFEIGLETEPFDIPTEPRDIYAMPTPVQKVFRMLTPSGELRRMTMKVWREPGQGSEPAPVAYEGTAVIESARVRFERFPYELSDCRGRVSFNAEQFRVLSLIGRTSGGGTATVAGVITPSMDAPAVDIQIAAADVPIDEHLYAALKPKYRAALELLFNERAFERMAQAGHFLTNDRYNKLEERASALRRRLEQIDATLDPDGAEAIERQIAELGAALQTPVFDLGGRVDAVVYVTREPGTETRTQVAADIDIREAGIVFKHFPYPLRLSGGKLAIARNNLHLTGVRGRGLHGGVGWLEGDIALPPGREGNDARHAPADAEPRMVEVRPDLRVKARLPIDAVLLDALPRPQDQFVRDLHASGYINLAGQITHEPANGEPDVQLLIDLEETKVEPGRGRFALDKLEGQVAVSLEKVKFEKVTGHRGEGRIVLDGEAGWGERRRRLDLTIDARGLDFSDPLLDLARPYTPIDPAWPKWVERFGPRGRFDATAALNQTGDDPADVTVRVRPESFSYLRDDKRVTLKDARGEVVITPGKIRFDAIEGELGGSRVTLDGDLKLGEAPVAELAIKARGEKVTDELRRALPGAVRELIDALGIDGRFDADFTRVRLSPGAEDGQTVRSIVGQVRSANARADLGVPVQHIDAVVKLAITAVAGREHPRVRAKIEAQRLSVRGRTITDLTAAVQSVGDSPLLNITDLRGRLYEGAVAGSGSIMLDRKRYSFRLALSDVRLETFLHRGQAPEADAPKMDGDLTASFNVEGGWGEAGKVRGRGQIQVREGDMYQLPLALGLLHITHLSLPTTKRFERADVSYYIKDGKIVFEQIVVESPHMRMAGEGSLVMDSEKLDITLTSSNPSGLDLGPVTDLVDAVRNQLVTIRVTGTLDNPNRDVKQFTGLTRAWRDVFGEARSEPN